MTHRHILRGSDTVLFLPKHHLKGKWLLSPTARGGESLLRESRHRYLLLESRAQVCATQMQPRAGAPRDATRDQRAQNPIRHEPHLERPARESRAAASADCTRLTQCAPHGVRVEKHDHAQARPATRLEACALHANGSFSREQQRIAPRVHRALRWSVESASALRCATHPDDRNSNNPEDISNNPEDIDPESSLSNSKQNLSQHTHSPSLRIVLSFLNFSVRE